MGAYVQRLLDAVVATLGHFNINAQKDRDAIGVWVNDAKICALGVRIRRGVSTHGIALNVETDLSFFDLIVPCGLPGKAVMSMRNVLRDRTPSLQSVKEVLVENIERFLMHATPPI